ncbi:MAG TPA: hypothetical protein VFS75_00150 [Candidatus Paceibacterota bacterium]|nr:hypothetical protein [Candidatus Paceibacterota bacterium]
MKKLHLALLFALFFVGVHTASADTASDWMAQNCEDLNFGEYGLITPMLYVTPDGTQDLIQIGEPVTFSVHGNLTENVDLSFSDSAITMGQKQCLDGSAYGADGCPQLGQCTGTGTSTQCHQRYNFKQTATLTGTPRDIVVKVPNGGMRAYNGASGKSVCQLLHVRRERQTYTLGLGIDKPAFGAKEAFKVTLSGMSWSKAKEVFGTNPPFSFTRSNAPWTSCENGIFRNSVGGGCSGDSVLSCGLLPDQSAPQYLCAVTGTGALPNSATDVIYTAYIPKLQDQFDTYAYDNGDQSITLTKLGQGNDGGMTNYMNCPAGQGVDPSSPSGGCTRCQNIANDFKSHISSCGSAQDSYKWREQTYSDFYRNYSVCDVSVTDGSACTTVGAMCIKHDPDRAFECKNTVGESYTQYYGRVIDGASGGTKGLAGVTVNPHHITAGYLGFDCSKLTTTTDADGNFRFSDSDSKSLCLTLAGASVKYSKDGYFDATGAVGDEFDRMIPTVTMLPLSGSDQTTQTGPLSIDNGNQTMNGNDVVFTIHNAIQGQVEACYQVLHHPNTGVNTDPNTPCSEWAPFNGNDEWHFHPENQTLVGTLGVNAVDKNGNPVWNIPGLQVRSSFRKVGTTDVVTATMTVAGNAQQGNNDGNGESSGHWTHTAGHFSPMPPACTSTPTDGAACSPIGSACSTANDDWSCSGAKSGQAGPEAQAEPQKPGLIENAINRIGRVGGAIGDSFIRIGGYTGSFFRGMLVNFGIVLSE